MMKREELYFKRIYAGRVDVFFEPPFFKIIHLDRYLWASAHLSDSALILDLGCGTGYGAPLIRRRTRGLIILADISADALQYGKKFYPVKNCERVVCDALHLPFRDEVFDGCLMLEVIEHLLQPEKALEEANRILKRSGVFIITTPNADNFSYRIYRYFGKPIKVGKHHVKEFGYDEFKFILKKAGFKIVEEMGQLFYFPGAFKVAFKFPRLARLLIKTGRRFPKYSLHQCYVCEKIK
ncbi:MAG: methyltransferase domain-containing protein [Candidatus Verstraetearchaeota archaeon]|nr:methyltransferase domain-containing protein [Candidatus Verstraetearchaeota archaeon]